MKKMAICMLLLFALSGSANAMKDSPDGFRNLKWGDPVSALGETTLRETSMGMEIYEKKEEKLSIGTAELIKIGYAFYNNHLTTVLIKFTGESNESIIREAMFARYGFPDIYKPHINKYNWLDSKNFIALDYNKYNNTGSISFISMQYYNIYQAGLKEQGALAAGDL